MPNRAFRTLVFVATLLAFAAPARAEDKAAPKITHVPVTKAAKGEPLVITAQFQDESEIFAPTLYFRTAGKGKFGSVAMAKQGDGYAGTIPLAPPVDYWIEVYDELGNGPARVGGPMKPLHVEAVEKEKPKAAPVAKAKPKVIPGPTIVHVPVKSGETGALVTISARFEGPNGVFAPTLYLRPSGGTNVRSLTFEKSGDGYVARFALDAPTDYWIEVYDEQGNGPSALGSAASPLHVEAEAPKPLPPVEVVTPPEPPPLAWYEGTWQEVPKTWWLAGGAGVVVLGTVAAVVAANAGPPAPVLQGLVAPRR